MCHAASHKSERGTPSHNSSLCSGQYNCAVVAVQINMDNLRNNHHKYCELIPDPSEYLSTLPDFTEM